MNREEFDILFETHLVRPLAASGFKTKGKSVYIVDDRNIAVSLIRLGGKFSTPNSIAHILCLRHSFLPDNIDEKIISGFCSEITDYPFKLLPANASQEIKDGVQYRSQNLRYDHEEFDYSDKSETEVIAYIDSVRQAILDLLDWARGSGSKNIGTLIKKGSNGDWIEKMWLKAYTARPMP